MDLENLTINSEDLTKTFEIFEAPQPEKPLKIEPEEKMINMFNEYSEDEH